MQKDLVRQYYPETEFGGFTNASPVVSFYNRVNAMLHQESVVLDVGCGRGGWEETDIEYLRQLQTLKGKCQKVIGIDVAAAGAENPTLDEFRRIDPNLAHWPVATGEVDIVVSDSVLEHIETPQTFFDECHRVLKPNGILCIRTFNVRHYVGIISRLLPNRLHTSALNVAQPSRQEEDVFPTFYRCNTPRSMRKILRKSGFQGCVYSQEPNSAYLAFSSLTYWASVVYQRLAPPPLRWNILAFARRQEQPS
ncbi:MAG: class I SAM-dependent methyltransferase [Verrucomicrobia bacterium]|nr:class I SAM-dependent methyltransferase [Verrucomicrobiota bacterium]